MLSVESAVLVRTFVVGLVQGRQASGDLGITALSGMLIAKGSTRRRVTQTPHEFRERRAGLRGEDGAGVPEIVPAERWSTRCPSCRIPDLVQGGRRHVLSVPRWEEQRLPR